MNQALTILKQTDDYLVTKNNNTGSLDFFIHKTANNKKFIKCLELANKISLLPNDELRELVYNEGLQKNWEYERLFSRSIGFCFTIKTFEIDWEVAEDYITDELILVLLDAITARYQTLEKLLKAGFRVLKKYLPKCPNTSKDLLFQIIEEERNLPFESKLVEDFIQLEPSKLAKFHAELAKKDVALIDQEKLQKLMPIHARGNKSDSLLGRVFDCLVNNFDRTPTTLRIKINHHCNQYNESERYVNEVLEQGYSGRSNEENYFPTVTYSYGEVVYSSYGRKRE